MTTLKKQKQLEALFLKILEQVRAPQSQEMGRDKGRWPEGFRASKRVKALTSHLPQPLLLPDLRSRVCS